MPVIEYQNPFAVAADTAGKVLLGKKQQDLDNRNFLLQKAQADSEAAYKQALTKNAQGELELSQRNAGIDPATGKPAQLAGVPEVGPGASLDDQYKNTLLRARAYEKQGFLGPANQLYAQADKIELQIHQAKQDALAYMREADNRLRILSQAQHWSAQEKEQARHNLATEAESIRKGNLTYEAAMARVGATIEAAGIRAGAEERGQDITHADRIRGQNLEHQDRLRGQNLRGLGGGVDGNLSGGIIDTINKVVGDPKNASNPYQAAANAISTSKMTPLQKRAALDYVNKLRISSGTKATSTDNGVF